MKKIFPNPFIIPFMIVAILLILTDVTFAYSASKTNAQLAREYAEKHYPDCEVVFLNKYDDEKIENRLGEDIVYIEKFVSYSAGGRYGYSKEGYYVAYNKKVKKNKKVVSYFIYNPYSNYCDDVVAVVDNHKVR